MLQAAKRTRTKMYFSHLHLQVLVTGNTSHAKGEERILYLPKHSEKYLLPFLEIRASSSYVVQKAPPEEVC